MGLPRIVSEGWSDERRLLLQSPELDNETLNSLSQYNFCVQILGGQEWPLLLLRVFAIRFVTAGDVIEAQEHTQPCCSVAHDQQSAALAWQRSA
jgi:hypothetical protein